MENDNKIIEQLPYAITLQWNDANTENTPASWHYVSGLLSGILIFREDIREELTFLVGIAAIRAHMAAKGNASRFSTLTPKERIQELFSLKRTLQEIHGYAENLEIFSDTALSSMAGRYGDEDPAYTRRMIDASLLALQQLEELAIELKRVMEVQHG